jgi:hypothetical protein
MKVKDLIKQLEQYDPEATVLVADNEELKIWYEAIESMVLGKLQEVVLYGKVSTARKDRSVPIPADQYFNL